MRYGINEYTNITHGLDFSTWPDRAVCIEEADARFDVNDETGCRFAVDVYRFGVQSTVGGDEATVNLGAVRDEVTELIADYNTKGVIARLAYDDNSNNVHLYLYAKNSGTNTLGTQLYQSSPITFVTNGTLELFVNETNAVLEYAGTQYASVAHSLELDTWPNGAVCIVEAEDLASGDTVYVEMDHLRAERPDTTRDTYFAEGFAGYPAGIMLRAETEYEHRLGN